AGGQSARLLENGGMPLGSSSKRLPASFSGRLQPGETLILFTDGVIEAVGGSGEQYGYDRFISLCQASWHQDLETFWQRIIAGYRSWAICQDDDLTFLLLRLEAEDAQ
ncbi:MAG TPA: SpoIIE family protein phosphatase, partial [Candidatus Ozemobacteraceae bacterium]|nr:SpoIIE family protein phosphatase [Candidatus Ozemobacteraceae bacterium]